MADQIVYSESMRSESYEQPFLKKEVVYIQDNNSGGVYNGQIIFDTTQLANSGKFQSWGGNDSYIVIPYVVAFKSNANNTGAKTPNFFSLKNGYWSIIHSMSVDYNGTNVVQLTPYLNMYCSYKAVTSWSASDQIKYGATCNFFKDSVDSIQWSNTLTASGKGVLNNRIQIGALTDFQGGNAASLTTQISAMWNDGLRQRCLNTNFYNYGSIGPNFLSATNSPFVGQSNFTASSDISVDGDTTNFTFWYNYVCTIPLKYLSDWFDKLPLLKGGQMRIVINYNAGSCVLTNVLNTSVTTTALPVLTAGSTIPYQYLSGAVNNPNYNVANGTLNVASNVYQVTPSGGALASNNVLNSCRLYISLYTLNPVFEEQYLSMNSTKEIVYRDIYEYTVSSISGQFNNLLSNGITSPKTLIIVPFINGTTAGQFSDLAGFNSLISPFSSGPSQPDPCLALANFNVQLSGVNIFNNNVTYGWEMFLGEVSRVNAINGGQTTGLSSGLVSHHDWERGYRYVVVDLSRGYKADDFIPKSVLINGQNYSTKTVDLFCFLEFERKVSISTSTGQIVQV